jgi:hypothetical protein
MTFLLQLPISADSWEKLIYGILGAVVSALIYWLLTRRKTTSETDRNYQQMALEVSKSLAEWIDRFEDAKKEMIEVVKQMGDVQKAFDDCQEDCEDCRQLLSAAKELLECFESAIKDLVEHGPLIEDLATLKRRVQRYTEQEHLMGA